MPLDPTEELHPQTSEPWIPHCVISRLPRRTGRYAVIGCKLKQNANEGCNAATVVQVLQDLFKAQYTPPTPTRRNCFVASRRRRRCVHEFGTTADGFGDANAHRSRRPLPSSRLPTGVYTTPTRRDSTVSSRRRRRCVLGLSLCL